MQQKTDRQGCDQHRLQVPITQDYLEIREDCPVLSSVAILHRKETSGLQIIEISYAHSESAATRAKPGLRGRFQEELDRSDQDPLWCNPHHWRYRDWG